MTDLDTARTDLGAIREDLAFMKSLAADEGRPHAMAGAMFLGAGVIYGLPLIVVWATLRGFLDLPQWWTSWISVFSSAVYLPFTAWISWRYRALKSPQGPTSRAYAALWGTVGLTTLVTVFVIFWAGARLHVQDMWQVWCCVCFAMYGSAWLGIAIVTRRNAWALVAAGSYLNAIVNALLVGSFDILLGVAIGITLWLGAPGALMMWRGRARARANA